MWADILYHEITFNFVLYLMNFAFTNCILECEMMKPVVLFIDFHIVMHYTLATDTV